MKKNEELQMAIKICLQAHRGQKDRGGELYMLHPMIVMFYMDTHNEKVVALLHDVVEDSSWTLEDLKKESFSDPIIEAIDAITKRKNEQYDDYISRVSKNELARKVKLQDLKHNMDISRLPAPKQKDRDRVIKYQAAFDKLTTYQVYFNKLKKIKIS